MTLESTQFALLEECCSQSGASIAKQKGILWEGPVRRLTQPHVALRKCCWIAGYIARHQQWGLYSMEGGLRVHAMCQVSSEAKQVLSQLEAAKADNVALVERLRYVQGYQSQSRRKGGPVQYAHHQRLKDIVDHFSRMH